MLTSRSGLVAKGTSRHLVRSESRGGGAASRRHLPLFSHYQNIINHITNMSFAQKVFRKYWILWFIVGAVIVAGAAMQFAPVSFTAPISFGIPAMVANVVNADVG